jgi:hypothetical protein
VLATTGDDDGDDASGSTTSAATSITTVPLSGVSVSTVPLSGTEVLAPTTIATSVGATGGGRAPTTSRPGSLIPLNTRVLEFKIPGFGVPATMTAASDPGAPIWVADSGGTLFAVAPAAEATGAAVVQTVRLDGQPSFMVASSEAVWATVPLSQKIHRVDVNTGTYRTIDIEVPGGYGSMALTSSSLWVVTPEGLVELDRSSGAEIGRFAARDLAGVATTGDLVWAWQSFPAGGGMRLVKVGADRQAAVTIDPGAGVSSIRGSDSGIWISRSDGRVFLLPGNTETFSSAEPSNALGASGGYLTAEGPDGVWAWSQNRPTISRIDPADFEPEEQVVAPGEVWALVNRDAALWVLADTGFFRIGLL